jgi:hypothetical protein
MNSGVLRVFVAALLALCPCHGFEPGPRPHEAVFDPDGILNAAERMEISAPLEKILQNDGVEVVAVILRNPDVPEPEVLAASLAAAWCQSPLHAVVVHVPDREGSPWIVAGGDLIHSIDQHEVRDELAAVRRDASREPDDVSTLRTAANATTDMLRYWMGREITRRAAIEKERAVIRLELENKARRQQTIMLTAAAAIILLIIGFVMSVSLLGKTRRTPASMP